MTLLETLTTQLRQASRHNPGEAPPDCVVWCDPERQWLAALPALRTALPEFLTLGPWNPALRQGPSFWLRLALERQRPEADIPAEAIPVIYLPGVARSDLRAGSECPDALKPLVDLLYRGTSWTQTNGRDWTLEAVLVARETGLALDVARDEPTRRAAIGSLPNLLGADVATLRGKRLEAEDFDRLMIADTPRDLLNWLNNPAIRQDYWEDSRWEALRSRGRDEYGFDPETDGTLEGGVRLASRSGAWKQVWERFCEAPALYPGIPGLLRQAQPIHEMIFDAEPWPKENEKAESALRVALSGLSALPASEARARIGKLELEHGVRRCWPWARLGLSPLALSLKHLGSLAALTLESPGGETLDAMAARHANDGWRADEVVLSSLREVSQEADLRAVETAVQAIYRPWLDAGARRFQELASNAALPPDQPAIQADEQECLLFADGLRFDLGRELARLTEEAGLLCQFTTRWAAVPTVTATAKPYASPVASQVTGGKLGETLEPMIAASAQPARTEPLRRLLEASGYQVLLHDDTGDPVKPGARAWVEAAEIDHFGHAHGAKLARHVAVELQAILERVQGLLAAGWKSVRVITDHGWLLLPGGLPKVDLPKYLAHTRWPRCAVIKETAQVSMPQSSWTWNRHELFAHPPGIACFGDGHEYAHGGLSLQECLLPVLRIAQETRAPEAAPAISSLKWRGLRCQVVIEPAMAGFTVDIRSKPSDPASTLAAPKPVEEGKASLVVEDDSLEGTSAAVVLLDAAGQVVSRMPTTVGEA